MITEKQLGYADMQKTMKSHVCATCGSDLSVAWLEGEYVLRCGNSLEHNTIKLKSRIPEYLKSEVYKSMTTAMSRMDEKQMTVRVNQSKFPQQLKPEEKIILVRAAMDYGLDPLMGELTIYQGKPFVSIDGRRRKALETKEYDGGGGRPATKEERESHKVEPDDYLYKYEVWKKGCSHPFEGWGKITKVEIDRAISQAKARGNDPYYLPLVKDPAGMSEKRAEAKALKRAFYIPLPSFEDIGIEEEPIADKPFVDTTATEVKPEKLRAGTQEPIFTDNDFR